MIVVRCSSGINHVCVHATYYPSLPPSSAFCAHSCLVFRPHNLLFHSNRFTCSLPSPLLLSFSLPSPFSAHLWAYPFIPDLLHPLQSSSVPLSQKEGRERESFSTGKLHPVCWRNLWRQRRLKSCLVD